MRMPRPLPAAAVAFEVLEDRRLFATGPGALDPTFGGDGSVVVAARARLTADGKVVVAGHSVIDGLDHVTAARLLADGTPDEGFGMFGVAVTDLEPSTTPIYLAVQPDGKLLLSSNTVSGTD